MLEEMSIMLNSENSVHIDIIELPEYVCYMRKYTGTPRESKAAMEALFHEACEKGYKFLPSEPLFTRNKLSDYVGGFNFDLVHDYMCCIPLEPEGAPKDAAKIPACRAVSLLYYGEYADMANTYKALGDKLKERDVKPKGDELRVLGIVAPYVGKNISPKNYVSRIVVPIE